MDTQLLQAGHCHHRPQGRSLVHRYALLRVLMSVRPGADDAALGAVDTLS
jgi:hypothetical protein